MIYQKIISFYLLATVTVFLIPPCRSADERDLPNIVYNPSFEKLAFMPVFSGEEIVATAQGNIGKRPYFWAWKKDMIIDYQHARCGKASLRINGPANNYTRSQVGYYVYDRGSNIRLVPGEKYLFSAWVKTHNVTGKGIRVRFHGKPSVEIPWISNAAQWKKVQAEFVAPVDISAPGGDVRIEWDVNQNESVWIDDIAIVPASGVIKKAPAPIISPDGGTFQGRKRVTLESDLPGAVIHYTIDGSEPDRFSVEYVGPFLVSGPSVVKAKTFHTGYESTTSEAVFNITARLGDGVPTNPIGYGTDVEKWWSEHIYNPSSPNYFDKPVISPGTRINVAQIRKKYPKSTSAGISEAIKELPSEGGVLWFDMEKGPYVVEKGFYIEGRSNLHFLSDGARITIKKDVLFFRSKDAADWKSFVLNPVENFYFNNLTFTGDGNNERALYFQNCVDVLFDNCTFSQFGKGQRYNIISANVNTDNIWLRNCVFKDNSSGFPVYWDGVHNGGCINCDFSGDYGGGTFLVFTNNDMSPFCAYERTGQYLVFDSCQFSGYPGRKGRNALSLTACNVLIKNNTVTGPFNSFVSWNGRGKSNTQPRLHFSSGGMKIIANDIKNVEAVVEFLGDLTQQHRFDQLSMDNRVYNNRISNIDYYFTWNPVSNPHFPPHSWLKNISFSNNTIINDHLPQVRLFADSENEITRITVANNKEIDVKVLDPDSINRIRNVHIQDNNIKIRQPELIVDRYGKKLKHEQIRFKKNEITF